ncbi:hypothetical protein MSAN_01041600 [Mycena sanguinolenta]|uniref:F-box domain-containing protein n=1 Tax=Mycena sanguinolenta TaxID=230812 RepID=A0A8H7D9N5_9AGAR|nr:hypothetical protein MSAN_01041600 [Mycena sanguinolenta]
MSSFALGPLSNRPPQYQNQYTLVNENGWLRLAAVSRRILALPPEILAEIFIFCLPIDDESYLPMTPNVDDAPIVLCAVCRQWRHVAFTTPQLWRSILFEVRDYFPASGDLYVEFCRKWLSRARSTSLHLCLDTFMPGDSFNALVELVIGNGKTLSSMRKYRCRLSLSTEISFCDAPRLHDVFIPFYTTRIQLPWNQLTSFGTNQLDIEACFELFRHGSKLVSAWIRIPAYNSSIPKTVFTLPRLRTLDLGGTDGMSMPITVLKCLKAPALETLALGFENSPNGCVLPDISPFLSFVSQSSFQLRTLTLSLIPSTTSALVECLKTTPSVANLHLQISLFIFNLDPIFIALTEQRDFLPNLESLHIALSQHESRSSPVAASLVFDMLVRRCAAGLQSFRFTGRNKSDQNDIKRYLESRPAYPELLTKGLRSYVGKRTYEDSFM